MKRIIKKSAGGFTTIELAVVLAIVAIMAAIALPGILKSLPEKRLRGAARDLYSDMQKARLLAVKHNTTVTVTFDTVNQTYSYCNQFDVTTSPVSCVDMRTVSLGNYGGIKYGNGSAGAANINDCNWNHDKCSPADAISFSYKGTVSSNNGSRSIYLQNANKDLCYAVSTTIYGFIRIRNYNGSKWE